MLKKSLTTLVLVSFLIISSLPAVISYNIPSNRIIYVDDDGGADDTRILDAIDEESKDCDCQDVSKYNLANAEKLLSRLEIYIKLILSRYTHNPEVTDKCQEILDIINTDDLRDIFCYVLMIIGILIEEIGKKVQDYRFIYFMLELTMMPIVILWNMYCD